MSTSLRFAMCSSLYLAGCGSDANTKQSTTTTPPLEERDDDADGSPATEDCDDSDPRVYPGAEEICGDGVINDCDSEEDPCALQAEVVAEDAAIWIEGEDGSLFGATMVAGDFNGDGIDDLAVGAPTWERRTSDEAGRLLMYAGGALPEPGDWEAQATAVFAAEQSDEELASSLAACDFNGDGYDDLAVGSPKWEAFDAEGGGVHLLFGGDDWDGVMDMDDAEQDFVQGAWLESEAGTAVACPDLNGDGFDDLVVGAPYAGEDEEGQTYVMYAGAGGAFTNDMRNADVTIDGRYHGWWDQEYGGRLASAGDLDGDGIEDLIVGAPGYGGSESNEGAADVWYGEDRGWDGTYEQFDAEGEARWTGSEEDGRFGYALAAVGDQDGDGYADVLVTEPFVDRNRGRVHIYPGSGIRHRPGEPEALAVITGSDADTYLGMAVAAGRDVDGDGEPDIAILAPGYQHFGDRAGGALVFTNALEGAVESDSANIVALGSTLRETAIGTAPQALALPRLDGDGPAEVAIGASTLSTVWLYANQGI